ncbi:protein Spindly-like [Physella acuta]|uniref:protein Spindly-like n=1 Tax=Physella acuta TaxID=109671 RepID=UPI0027DBF547|nr:protein Spindly-like [Physella acuta]XP_059145047.1 protein Spindly-like [Physella acuta]XP_059145048.1 protein Spindly-like [Physella acuta]XP_059145049.1 protein Spindly-like [Physella acuta]
METSLLIEDPLAEDLERKKQELHTAHRQIENLSANVRHLEDECNDLRSELEEQRRKLRGSLSEDKMKSDLMYRQQIEDMQQCLEETQASEKKAKEDVIYLEKRLKHLLETAVSVDTSARDNDDEKITSLQIRISELEDEKELLKSRLIEAAVELQKINEENLQLKQDLKEKDEEIECMEMQYTSQCNMYERLREENLELRAQLESEAGQVDTGKKGNSLFSEVDDRRVVAEKKIVKLETSIGQLEEQLTKEQKENKRLKQQILLLRQTAGKGYDKEKVEALKREVEAKMKTNIQLTEALYKKETSLKTTVVQDIPMPNLEEGSDKDRLYINFLQGIIKQTKKQLEEAQSECKQNHLQLMRTELHLSEAKNEIMTLKHERDQFRVMTSHLNMTIQEMQHKYEPERFAPPSKEKVKISLSESHQANQGGAHSSTQNLMTPLDPSTLFDPPSNTKENMPVRVNDLFGGNKSKSVRMKNEVSVLSSQGDQTVKTLKPDGKGNILKAQNGTGKYRNVTYSEVTENAAECKQQ